MIKGSKHSSETRVKMRAAHLTPEYRDAVKGWMQGNRHAAGKIVSAANQEKMTVAKGTDEFRAKMSAIHQAHDCHSHLRPVIGVTRIELRLRTLLEQAYPLALIEREYRIGRYRVDFAIPALMLAFEADGEYWHSLPGVKDREVRRDAALRALGWQVTRIPGKQIQDIKDVQQLSNFMLNSLSSIEYVLEAQ